MGKHFFSLWRALLFICRFFSSLVPLLTASWSDCRDPTVLGGLPTLGEQIAFLQASSSSIGAPGLLMCFPGDKNVTGLLDLRLDQINWGFRWGFFCEFTRCSYAKKILIACTLPSPCLTSWCICVPSLNNIPILWECSQMLALFQWKSHYSNSPYYLMYCQVLLAQGKSAL